MRFSLAYGNHSQHIHLSDMATYLRCVFEELGHEFEFNAHLTPDACNIVIEFFNDDSGASVVNAIRGGFDVIVIATEFVTGNTFNHFGHQAGEGDGWYDDHAKWQIRYNNFRRVADLCRGVWSLSSDALDTYRTIVPEQKLHLIPTGYTDGFATVRQRANERKNIDFLFTGMPTPWRNAILNKLRSVGAGVMVASHLTPPFIRDDLIARAKVCLNLRQYSGWKYPSTMRYFYHLMNESYLLSERCEFGSPLDKYVNFPANEEFLISCFEVLRDDNYSQIARDKLELFRQEMPAAPMVEALLDATFGTPVRA